MKDRLNCLLICGRRELRRASRSDVRNLSRYTVELKEMIESYRTFATTVTLSTSTERATRRKLVARKPSRSLGQRQTPGRKKIALGVDE